MRHRSRRYRRSTYARRRRQNWLPLITFVLVLGFFIWALFQFFSLLFSNVRTEVSSTSLEILQGRGEFRLSAENSQWTPAFSGQTFVEGDQLKTGRNAHFQLTFFDDNHFFLGENTELELLKLEKKSSDQVVAHWRLNQGTLWAQVAEDNTTKPDVKIYTPRSLVNITGTTFNLAVQPQQETLQLIAGKVQLDILGANDTVKETVDVSVGQEITLDDNTALSETNSLLKIITPEFLTSDWHLKNLEKFDPESAQAAREKLKASQAQTPPITENTATENTQEAPLNPELSAPVILSPANNTVIPASQNSIALQGTAPNNAFQIQVNGYTLSKFQPGDRKWTYFAATKFGTLKPGDNTYQVVAIDRQGQRSDVTTLNLNYEGVAPAPKTENTAKNLQTSVIQNLETAPKIENIEAPTDEFPLPKITTPALFATDPTATYQTSADRVTLFGTVPFGTNAVKVNGFQLRKFKPGDTKFKYTAIALGANGNMQEGENTYTIIALGPDQKFSQTAVKVHYTPLNVGE